MPLTQTGVLATIDWRRPWLAPFLPVARLVAGRDWRAALNRLATAAGLHNHRQLPLQFVPQTDLPEGVAYESYISQTGCVPTRDNLHDFFNALVWLHYPQMKQVLNALQAHEIDRAIALGDQSTVRGKLRDGATIFDENAALIISANVDVVEALREHRWQEALISQAAAFGKSVDIVLFGHALMEKLVAPYKSITAHAWVLRSPETYFSMPPEQQRLWLDQAAAPLMGQGLSTQDFTPLPILGVPGWWADQDAGFYADVSVFRPQRIRMA